MPHAELRTGVDATNLHCAACGRCSTRSSPRLSSTASAWSSNWQAPTARPRPSPSTRCCRIGSRAFVVMRVCGWCTSAPTVFSGLARALHRSRHAGCRRPLRAHQADGRGQRRRMPSRCAPPSSAPSSTPRMRCWAGSSRPRARCRDSAMPSSRPCRPLELARVIDEHVLANPRCLGASITWWGPASTSATC